MKKLVKGKMTSREIADWMGISYNTYKNSVNKRLKELEFYADFEKIFGGVVINKINIASYIKDLGEDDKLYLSEIQQCQDGLSTVSGMVRKIISESQGAYTQKDYNSLQYRIRKAGYRTFGRITSEDLKPRGVYGMRKYVWAVKVNDLNKYRFMNAEEEQIYKEIRDRYCKDCAEQVEKEALLKDAFKKQEINAEEYAAESIRLDFFNGVLAEFTEKTGVRLVRATEHEVFSSMLENLLDKR